MLIECPAGAAPRTPNATPDPRRAATHTKTPRSVTPGRGPASHQGDRIRTGRTGATNEDDNPGSAAGTGRPPQGVPAGARPHGAPPDRSGCRSQTETQPPAPGAQTVHRCRSGPAEHLVISLRPLEPVSARSFRFGPSDRSVDPACTLPNAPHNFEPRAFAPPPSRGRTGPRNPRSPTTPRPTPPPLVARRCVSATTPTPGPRFHRCWLHQAE